ncbi:ABC transporter permease [Conexibacter sp. SYSU D00693]|uniref:ABC transporter permease n=1 Tax=Conexibacter sp. SYSU D00693 TaxID=2812560 RepID=UPI00196B7000|nr:ABC transporter permease [Conexibacter sp. SYSU D00693]
MGAYILRRLLWTVLLVILVSAITFVIFRVLPSADPAALRAGRSPSPDTLRLIREQLGLDDPTYVQFWNFLKDLFLHFDLGRSYINDAPVRQQAFDRLGATLFLVLGAACIWFLVGVTIGIVSAVFRGRIWDRLAMGAALVMISAPVYWLGLVTLYLFSEDIGRFKLLPGSGAYQDADGFFDKIPALIMPWCVLATAFAAIYARLMRSGMLETLSEDYIRTARAKGLSKRRVVLKHATRSAITPIITVLGLDIGILFGGAILTETVFGIPGIGLYSFNAIERADLATIQGTTLILALGVALMSLLVDIIYAFLDPRVRYS